MASEGRMSDSGLDSKLPKTNAGAGESSESRHAEEKASDVEGGGMAERVVSLYENQRYYLSSWSSSLLPTDRYSWSDLSGKDQTEKDSFKPLQGWEWVGNWRVEAGETSDPLGWQYAVDFGWSWYSEMQKKTFVRRRKWVRTMRLGGQQESKKAFYGTDPFVTLRFSPGKLGLRFHTHNEITHVVTGGQACSKGVKEGWVISHVAGRRVHAGEEAHLQNLLKAFLSLDGDTDITFDTTGVLQLSEDEHALVLEFFELLDVDGDGHIDKQEAKAKLHEEANRLFADVDEDADGTITFEKFCQAFVRHKNRERTDPASVTYRDAKSTNREPSLSEALKRSIAYVKEYFRRSRMLLEQEVHGVAELQDDSSSEEENKDSNPSAEQKFWPLKKPREDKKPYHCS